MTEIVELVAFFVLFLGTLGALSFFCLRQYSGAGAIVSFDSNGCAEVVARNARDPVDFVSAIKGRIHSIPTACRAGHQA